MSENDPGRTGEFYLRHAGRVIWPRGSRDLTDTALCPACHTHLTSMVCSECQLNLGHEAANELLARSSEAAEALQRRAELIGRIRYETAMTKVAAPSLSLTQSRQSSAVTVTAIHTSADKSASASASIPTPVDTSVPRSVNTSVDASVNTSARTAASAASHSEPQRPAKTQRSSVQVVLLSVGVLLVSVAAIFFLTVAWFVAGLGFRFVIVALLTVATLTVAALLGRSRLTSTAEGIGAFAVVLVVLDIWAMRANNLFELAFVDGISYWGIALLASAALFFAWHALSRLRVASLAGFAVAVVGFGLLLAGVTEGQSAVTRLFVGFLGVAIAALLHRVTPLRHGAITRWWPAMDRAVERMLLQGVGLLSLVVAGLLAIFVNPGISVTPIWCLGAVTVVAATHSVVALSAVHRTRSTPSYRIFAYAAGCWAAFVAAGIAPAVAVRYDTLAFSLTVPVLVAVALGVALELFGRKFEEPRPARTAALLAAGSATIIAALTLLYSGGYAAWPLIRVLVRALGSVENFAGHNDANLAGTTIAAADNGWALLALIAVGALVLAAWTRAGLLRGRRHSLVALTLAVIIFAVPFVQSTPLIVALYLLLGGIALVILLRSHGRFSLGFLTPAAVTLLLAGETLGYVIGWPHTSTWWVGTISLVLALWFSRLVVSRPVASRLASPTAPTFRVPTLHVPTLHVPTLRAPTTNWRDGTRGVLLAAAITVALIGVTRIPSALAPDERWTDAIALANVIAAVALATAVLHLLLAGVAFRPKILTVIERRWAFYALLIPTVIVFAVPLRSIAANAVLVQPEPLGSIVRVSLLAAASILWVFTRANHGNLHWERFIVALSVAPITVLLAHETLFAAGAAVSAFTLAAPIVALFVAALALFRGTRSDSRARRDRAGLEIGSAVVLVPVALTAWAEGSALGWLVVMLAGLASLIVAISADGLFGSRSNRRHFGWLALLLATSGLWLGLARAGTVALEPYVLPVAGVLLITAVLIARYGRSDSTGAPGVVAASLTLCGLLVALIPLAVVSQSGSLVRPIVVALVAAGLMLGAQTMHWSPLRSHFLAATTLAGALALVITAVGQAQRLQRGPGAPDWQLELWLLLPAAVAVATAFLLARQADAASAPLRRSASVALVIAWATIVTFIELIVIASSADTWLSTPRAIGLVVTLAVLHVVSFWRREAPLGTLTSWSMFALAGLGLLTVLGFDVVHPFELVTVPVALALLGSGWLRLQNDPRARTWHWCGPGLALLLVPSLVLDFSYSEIWRIVGLGVVALIVVIIGSTRRLQAPFVIGASVLMVHGVAQLWPWIALAYSVIPWFLWLGAGGIVLIVLAARYERRIANFKSVALRIRALR